MKKLLLLSFLISFQSFALDSSIEEKIKEFEKKTGKQELNVKLPKPDKKMMEKINKLSQEAQTKYREQASNILSENGKIIINKPGKNKKKHKGILDNDQRIYIFMSSSVPEGVWIEYAKVIDEYKLGLNVPIIMKGCIGGCNKIMPTLKFVSNILTEKGKNKNGLLVDVQIDPFLFSKYNIQEVPCFVFGNVNVIDRTRSEGLDDNLKNNPKVFKSCGSFDFDFHIKKLYELSKNQNLKKLYEKLTKNSFYEGADD